MTEFKEQQLLFCVERGSMAGVLHFVDFTTLEEEEPLLYSCTVQKGWLKDFVPGGLYRLEVKNGNLVQYIKEREFMITQAYYVMLMERKHVFYDRAEDPFLPQQYYTFTDYRALMLYQARPMQRVLVKLARAGLNLLAILLPLGLLVLLGYRYWLSGGGSGVAVAVLAALPLTLWAMAMLGQGVNQLILRWPYTRYLTMQEICLTTGGKRSPIGMKAKKRNQALIVGGACLLVLLLVLLFVRL